MDTTPHEPVPSGLSDTAQAIAEKQAALDLELMAALQAKRKEHGEAILVDVKTAEDRQTHLGTHEPRPLNRAERRAQVAFYAKVLAQGNKQQPVVNPTIRPKSKARRRAH